MKRVLGGVAAALMIAAAAQANLGKGKILFREDFEAGLSREWKPKEFTRLTKHSVEKQGTNSFLRASADASASGLGVELAKISPAGSVLSWKWRIDKVPASGSEDKIETFDHTARIFVAFRTLIGPPRTINYVWANKTDIGKTFHHPNSGRARFIALQNGEAKAGQWIAEARDLSKDWISLFGGDEPPEIVGIGMMTDSDGTATQVVGDYDDIVLEALR